MPVGNCHETMVAQATQTGNAMSQAVFHIASGHEAIDSIDHGYGHVSSHSWQGIHFCPEVNGIAKFTFGDGSQPFVLLAQNEWQATVLQYVAISLQNKIADILPFERQVSCVRGQMRTHRQPDQIVGIGCGMRLIKVVDTPN